jgi:glutathione S-transferase
MKLYYIETMNPRKVCATAKHLGVPLDYVRLEVGPRGTRSKDYAAINPNGTAPTLLDGEHTLWESAAIAAHLATSVGSDMWPTRDPRAQMEVLRWMSWDAFHWSRAIGPMYFEHYVKPKLGMGEPDRAVRERQAPLVDKHARVLDAHLASRDFVACGHLTVADFCLGAMLPDWDELDMPLEAYANIRRWHDGLMKIDAWRDPWPASAQAFAAAS